MQTGQRGAQRPAPGNTTGMTFYRQQREQDLKRNQAEAARRAEERVPIYLSPDELVAEVQATLKNGTAFWNESMGEVEIDMTRSYH
jgi:hypothetical protein